ncbi:hypothetical protein ACFL49_02120 [Candidatus Omnitrophota bacterium]
MKLLEMNFGVFVRYKKLIACFIIASSILLVAADALKVENGWILPEITFSHLKFLSNEQADRIELSFSMKEMEKILWWEYICDGNAGRLVTGALSLFTVKFRAWLFQFIPPKPSIALGWIFSLMLTPLLLFRFLRQYVGLGVIGSAFITAFYVLSPATVGGTFLLYHPGRVLVSFFYILILNMFFALNKRMDEKQKSFLLKFSLFLVMLVSFFTGVEMFIIFLLVPIYFSNCFISKNMFSSVRDVFSLKKLKAFITTQQRDAFYVFAGVLVVYLLIIKIFLPCMAREVGYLYEHMSFYKYQIQIYSHFVSPITLLFSVKYVLGVIINLYWFIIANIGLRPLLPLSIADLVGVMNGKIDDFLIPFNALFIFQCLVFHCVGLAAYLFVRLRFQYLKGMLKYLIALILITAWMTFLHGNSSKFLIPYSTYIYGSPFTIIFAIFLGAGLKSFNRSKVVYALVIYALCLASVVSYVEAKSMNLIIKHGWRIWLLNSEFNVNVDDIHHKNVKLWHDVKSKKVEFDQNILKIDDKMRYNFSRISVGHDPYYTKVWQELSVSEKYITAMNFAAFAKDLEEH